MRPLSNYIEKGRSDGGVGIHDNYDEYNMLGKQNISLLIMQGSAMLISIMV